MDKSYKEKLAEPIWQRFSFLEDEIMSDIIRRLKKTGEITSTADWQINLLTLMGNSSEEIEARIKETLNASYPEIFELYDEVIEKEYTRNKAIYDQINAEYIPYEENEQLKQLVQGFMSQSLEGLNNITQSLGFYLDYGNGKFVYTPLSEIYQGYLDKAMYGIASGAFDYNTMLRKVVRQLTNSGLRTIDYASGYCSRVPVAARRAVMTGISQLAGKISDMNAEKLGTQHFEVAWHANARPAHRVWQGKVWSKEQLVSVCGLGTVSGLLGANCYHEYYPFFPGLSERSWTDEWLDEQNQKEDITKEFKGKEYNSYEATQKQRSMETAMRAQRQRVRLMQEVGDDPDEIMLAKAKYQAQLEEYTKFSKRMELVEQRERVYIDGLGRVAPSKVSYQKHLKAVAEKERRAIIDSEIKAIGIKGEVHLEVGKIDVSEYAFDDRHINKDRHHNVSRKDINQIMREADVLIERWNGRFKNYYGPNGSVYIDVEQKNIRTAFWADEYDENIKKLREVLKKHGKQGLSSYGRENK